MSFFSVAGRVWRIWVYSISFFWMQETVRTPHRDPYSRARRWRHSHAAPSCRAPCGCFAGRSACTQDKDDFLSLLNFTNMCIEITSVADPDPVRIHRIHIFSVLLNPGQDPLVRGMDPYPDPDPNPDPLVHKSEAWIRGSGSTPKCHGSATLEITKAELYFVI